MKTKKKNKKAVENFIIRDWTGREMEAKDKKSGLSLPVTFKTFDDAWDYIYTKFPDDEEEWGEYFVCDLSKGE